MSGASKKLMGTTAAGAAFTAIEDVFSTYLYTGNGSTQTITNDIDLAGEGGLVWLKSRSVSQAHRLIDSARNLRASLLTNSTSSESNLDTGPLVFNSDGFSLPSFSSDVNTNGTTYASWTFRKAPRFFDVVTWTGTGTNALTLDHNLGVTPGFVAVKRTDSSQNWMCAHRDTGTSSIWTSMTGTFGFNQTNGAGNQMTGADYAKWTDTQINLYRTISASGTDPTYGYNISGATYVAYLFAHDPLGPSEDGSDGLIACGSFNSGGSAAYVDVNLGWEPQWVLWKISDGAGSWYLFDTMRGIPTGGTDRELYANTSGAEVGNGDYIDVTSTGFRLTPGGWNGVVGPNKNVVYIAIRRGPMRVPESGTEVFAPVLGDATPPAFNTTFPVDLNVYKWRTSSAGSIWSDRLRGAFSLNSSTTNAEFANTLAQYDYMDGFGDSTVFNSDYVGWNFRRAPNFFDVVAYTGTGADLTLPHNLTVAPELVIAKVRNTGSSWGVATSNDWSKYLLLNSANAQATASLFGTPDATNFYPTASGGFSGSGNTYIAYLFATLAGVSKVGSYTGNGTSQTINCGFTTGARFILIKRTDSTGDWYVWDTARGIVAGNDPHLSLNTTAAEVTTDDTIDPDSSGFIVNQVAATNVNVSSASYIYLAIA